jgi:ABC-type spermidine/putrescine transport system permease subunit I
MSRSSDRDTPAGTAAAGGNRAGVGGTPANATAAPAAASAVPAAAFRQRRARRRALGSLALLAPLVALMLVFFVYPIGRILVTSLFDPTPTLAHYARALGDPIYLRVLRTTVKISLLTTFWCLLLGYPMAYLMAEAPPRLRGALVALVMLPFFMSLLVKNYAWTVLLQETGVLNTWLRWADLIKQPLPLMYNLFGVLVGMVQMLLPFMILPLFSTFSGMDRSLRQASRSLGAGPVRTFLHVTLPLSLPGAGAGTLLVFIVSLGFFITPALLGSPAEMMLANLIDNQVRQVINWPFASALAMLLLAFTLLSYLVYHRLFGAERLWERV